MSGASAESCGHRLHRPLAGKNAPERRRGTDPTLRQRVSVNTASSTITAAVMKHASSPPQALPGCAAAGRNNATRFRHAASVVEQTTLRPVKRSAERTRHAAIRHCAANIDVSSGRIVRRDARSRRLCVQDPAIVPAPQARVDGEQILIVRRGSHANLRSQLNVVSVPTGRVATVPPGETFQAVPRGCTGKSSPLVRYVNDAKVQRTTARWLASPRRCRRGTTCCGRRNASRRRRISGRRRAADEVRSTSIRLCFPMT